MDDKVIAGLETDTEKMNRLESKVESLTTTISDLTEERKTFVKVLHKCVDWVDYLYREEPDNEEMEECIRDINELLTPTTDTQHSEAKNARNFIFEGLVYEMNIALYNKYPDSKHPHPDIIDEIMVLIKKYTEKYNPTDNSTTPPTKD